MTYRKIANYTPHTGQVAREDYAYSGMGSVTPPEALVAGEGFARTVNEMRGLGESAAPSGVAVFLTGAVIGFFVGREYARRKVKLF